MEEKKTGSNNVEVNKVEAKTLFVGLGGTGGEIVRCVAEMCQRGETENIEFVCLDTNVNDLTAIRDSRALIHYVQISNAQTVGDYLYYDRDAREDWFPVNPVMYDKTVSEGAGQVRAIARIALNATIRQGNLQPLYDAVDRLFCKDGKGLKQALRIVLVCTASGGTGSGLILPVSLLLRDFMKRRHPETALLMRGMVLLPGALDSVIGSTQESQSQKRNAYATIKELNAFMMKGSGFFDIEENLKRYRDLHVDCLTEEGLKPLDSLPMDFCFLMEGQDAEGSSMVTFDQYVEMAARSLYEQNVGPMRKNTSSLEDNILKEISVKGNLGRNRFGGIGASVLCYPYEDIADYVAYGWALSSIGSDSDVGKWCQYDKAYEIQRADAKKKGLSATEAPSRDEVYINTLKAKKDPFSRDIRNMYLSENQEAKLENWLEKLTEHMHEMFRQDSAIQRSMEPVAKLADRIDYTKEFNQNKANLWLGNLRIFENHVRGITKKLAGREANAIFSNEEKTINVDDEFMVEALLKNPEKNIAHPVAARAILYRAKNEFHKRLEEAKEEMGKEEERLKVYASDVYLPEAFHVDLKKRKNEKIGSFDQLCRAEADAKSKEQYYEKLNNHFPQYHKAILDYGYAIMEYETYRIGFEFLDDVCKMYERFFQSFREKVSGLNRKRDDLVQILRFEKGDSHLNVCAEEDVLEELARTTVKQEEEGSLLDRELNGAIFDAVKANVAFERESRALDVVEEDRRIDIFDDIVLEYFRKSVRRKCENLDLNVIQAIEMECRLKDRLRKRREMENSLEPGDETKLIADRVPQEELESYIVECLKKATRLAAPGIQRVNNEESREICCAAYNSSLEGMREYTMSKLFARGVNAEGTDAVSKYELHFFIALYNLTPDKLYRFAAPRRDDERLRSGGTYHHAYAEYGKLLGPDSRKSMMISTHIDRRWDSIAFMPELDMEYMRDQMLKIHKALIYALVYGKITYGMMSYVDNARKVYSYENSSQRKVDLIVSNGSQCDEFYEVVDALYIDASVVEDIYAMKAAEEKGDRLRHSDYDGTKFAKLVRSFQLPQKRDQREEGIWRTTSVFAPSAGQKNSDAQKEGASLFEIALGYYLSLPNGQRYIGEIEELVDAVIEVFRWEIGSFEAEEDAKFILCNVLKQQFLLFVSHYLDYGTKRRIFNSKVVDLAYRRICSVVTEAPEPDNYETMLEEMREAVVSVQREQDALEKAGA